MRRFIRFVLRTLLVVLVVQLLPYLSARLVTFRGHLGGDLADDAVVEPAESLLVMPDKGERLSWRRPVLVTLPDKTPYAGDEQVNYLRGYAVAFTRYTNRPFT